MGVLKHPCPEVVLELCWWVQSGWVVGFCQYYSFGKVCPSSSSILSGQCQMQSFLLKPLKEDSCSTFLHGKQPWNCFWHFFPVCNSVAHVFVADMWKYSFRCRLFGGMMYVLASINLRRGLSCFVFKQLGWPVTCWNWVTKLCEFSRTPTAVQNIPNSVTVWWCICRAVWLWFFTFTAEGQSSPKGKHHL